MVMKTMSVLSKTVHNGDVILVPRGARAPHTRARSRADAESEAGDVIDLGAPRVLRQAPPSQLVFARKLRRIQPYTPNPRLYPGPPRHKKSRPKRAEARSGEARGRRKRKRVYRRPLPNSRLYRPAQQRPPPPPAWPRAAWPPPTPPARLETASRAALRLSERRPPPTPGRGARPGRPPTAAPLVARATAPPAPPSRRLVVTLPGAAPEPRYGPAARYRLRSLDTDSGASTPVAACTHTHARTRPLAATVMDTTNRQSTSPEDGSEGNETLSAPSEFLAEFLSAIMRRQYAEALKYCRLILQYEPHNATARGFYPLLQHKVHKHKHPPGCAGGSSSEEASEHAPAPASQLHYAHEQEQEQEGGWCSGSSSRASQSSLELDSSEAAHSSPSPSLSLSRRTDSASGGCWESTGSASRSEADDNGNVAPCAADVHNDNASAPAPLCSHAESTASLRRLRAQFTCSIK